jgi:asparagine synthase (glutamine-hydrolysing)
MCGILGFIGSDVSDIDLSILKHRGPDSSGHVFINEKNVFLGHTRLAIQDLSESGAQPMTSASGRFIISFNGEIYNHLELRKLVSLDTGNEWVGSSDTETLVTCFELFGIEATIGMCEGMFAVGVWDNEKNQLYLIRDRFGEKPLYYGVLNGILMFASELKALKTHPSFDLEIDRESLALFFKNNLIPAPFSIYKDVFKVMPGTIMCFDVPSYSCTTNRYWEIHESTDVFESSCQDSLIDSIDQKLKEVVINQLISDVPVGAFLSGGVDSSLIVSIMQAVSVDKVNTFSIGFDEEKYNEADQAEAVAHFLGTHHESLIVAPSDLVEAAKNISEVYDEPFADYSQIPTYLISKFAKEKVSVVLTGDGGDELFAGYNRHIALDRHKWVFEIPRGIRVILSRILLSVPVTWYDRLAGVLKLDRRIPNFGSKIVKAAKVLSSHSIYDGYEKLTRSWDTEQELVKGVVGQKNLEHQNRLLDLGNGSKMKDMMRWDVESYLADGVLVKLDRAAMSVSLEGRVPFLNHNFAEYAWGIPTRFNIGGGVGKLLLRKVLARYIPEQLTNKPKRGFSLPMAEWLRGPLRPWADELLSTDRISKDGYLEPHLIQEKWVEHKKGLKDWSQDLWCVLIFQMWLEEN